MKVHHRLDEAQVAELEMEFANVFPSQPSREEQSIADRVRRSLSWMRRAVQVSSADAPPRYVDLWIALNALYGVPPYVPNFQPDEKRDFKHFMRLLRALPNSSDPLRRTMKSIERRTYNLIGNEYLWKEFWREDFQAQKKKARKSKNECEAALRDEDFVTFFACLFERLSVLRNQIFHGSSSENTTKSEDALIPSLLVLEEILPVFLTLMLRYAKGKDWPLVPYPGWETLQHPR